MQNYEEDNAYAVNFIFNRGIIKCINYVSWWIVTT